MTTSYTLTPDDLTDYLFLGYWKAPKNRNRRILLQFILPIVALVSGGYLLAFGSTLLGQAYGGFVLLAGGILLGFPTVYRFGIHKQSKQIAAHEQGRLLFEPTIMTLSEEGQLSFALENSEYEPLVLSPEDVSRWDETESHLAIHYGDQDQFRVLPKAQLSDEVESGVKAWLKTNDL
ncbi:MAG: hypothetical protein AAF740_06880 [Bacteroidota bacterium]